MYIIFPRSCGISCQAVLPNVSIQTIWTMLSCYGRWLARSHAPVQKLIFHFIKYWANPLQCLSTISLEATFYAEWRGPICRDANTIRVEITNTLDEKMGKFWCSYFKRFIRKWTALHLTPVHESLSQSEKKGAGLSVNDLELAFNCVIVLQPNLKS